jgi:hypothetical protein
VLLSPGGSLRPSPSGGKPDIWALGALEEVALWHASVPPPSRGPSGRGSAIWMATAAGIEAAIDLLTEPDEREEPRRP